MTDTKPAYDAQTDQALAQMREQRHQGGELVEGMLPAAGNLATAIREQFPGQDALTARVLMAASSMLAGLERELRHLGAKPEVICPAVLGVLGFAAEDLSRTGAEGAEGSG